MQFFTGPRHYGCFCDWRMRSLFRGSAYLAMFQRIIHIVEHTHVAPSESTKTLSSCCAHACPALTCSLLIIFLGSERHQSPAPPRRTASHAKKVRWGRKTAHPICRNRNILHKGPFQVHCRKFGAPPRSWAPFSKCDHARDIVTTLEIYVQPLFPK